MIKYVIESIRHNVHIEGWLLVVQGWALVILGFSIDTAKHVSEWAEAIRPTLACISLACATLSTIYGAYKLSKKK